MRGTLSLAGYPRQRSTALPSPWPRATAVAAFLIAMLLIDSPWSYGPAAGGVLLACWLDPRFPRRAPHRPLRTYLFALLCAVVAILGLGMLTLWFAMNILP